MGCAHALLEETPIRKIPLGRLCMRWDNVVGKDVEALGEELDRKTWASDRENWRQGYYIMTRWSYSDSDYLIYIYLDRTHDKNSNLDNLFRFECTNLIIPYYYTLFAESL